MNNQSELLLPVSNMTMLLAAIHHGADAVYFGVPFFNARGRSTDFTLDEVKEMIDLAHLYGVKVNLAFNVVIFQKELARVIELLEAIIPMGPDAFIVQDLGLAQLIRTMAPDQRIHASTQMTITNSDAIKLLDDLNIQRFVLGRENSIAEIQSIRQKTTKELEVFVHGALCVAYSGQCFTSESIGGRSANRGQCAQSCRLPYELYADGKKVELGDKKYLVSPKDFMGLAEASQLQSMGIDSLKIEGRLKSPEYVAASAKHYKAVLQGEPLNLEERKQALSSTYSRGFYSGWMHGVNHQELVDGTFSAHRGMEIGRVIEVRKSTFILDSSVELLAGQGLLIAGDREIGGKIFKATKLKKYWEIELLQKNLNIQINDMVYLNSDEKMDKELQKAWLTREGKKKIPIYFDVKATLGSKLIIKMNDFNGQEVITQSDSNLEASKHQSLTLEYIFDELSSLSASVYRATKISGPIEGQLFLHHRELKKMRQDLIQKMNDLRIKRDLKVTIKPVICPPAQVTTGESLLNILLRTKAQVEGLISAKLKGLFNSHEHRLGIVILDFEFGKDYAPSVEILKQAGFKTAIATTRILKPNEYHHLKLIMQINPDKILVRNLGALEFLRNECSIPLFGDFSLNVTNSYSHQYLLTKGLESVCCSYDLNQEQLDDLLKASDPGKLEITLHQYMPEFHMEHCVFAAFLSQGSSFRDCGKPCEKHDVTLKDTYGNWHFLKADHECRNTFYKATPQSASFLIQPLLQQRIGAFRIEALKESPTVLNKKIYTYLNLMSDMISEKVAHNLLKMEESYGLGSGELRRSDNYQNKKQ